MDKNECGTEKLEGMVVVFDLYTEVWGTRKKLLEESNVLSRLNCTASAELFRSKADGMTVALLILAKTYGLHVCPKCQRLGELVHYGASEFPDNIARSAYLCECNSDCVPFEWVD